MGRVTTSPLLWLPSAADGIQLTPSGTAWTFSSYGDFTTAAATTIYPLRLAVLPNDGAVMTAASALFELAYDSSGGTTRSALARLLVRFGANQWAATIPLPLAFSSCPAGSRVSCRMAHGATGDTDVYRVALGYQSALGLSTNRVTGVQLVAPDIMTGGTASVAGTSAWANGAWTQVLPALSVASYLTGVSISDPAIDLEVDIGADPAGGTSYASICDSLPYEGAVVGTGYIELPHPIKVGAGATVAVRQRANTSVAFFVTLWYVPA